MFPNPNKHEIRHIECMLLKILKGVLSTMDFSICAKIIIKNKNENLGRFPFCNGFDHLSQNNNNYKLIN
jgi:hypothetical protein